MGRQPILDAKRKTHAYELLFRSSNENRADGGRSIPGELATQQVISNAFLSLGLDSIAGGLPVFINFPRSLLLDATAALLPSQSIVVEVLEDVECDAPVLEACRSLKQRGYRLAVDDYCGEAGREDLINLADYLKVDFRATDVPTRREIRSRFQRRGLTFLAEKVETLEEFNEAAEFGYSLFQGYFFARPQVLRGSEVPSLKANGLRIIQAVHADPPDLPAIAQLVRNDVSLCRRLLRYMNSAAFAWHAPVVSVERALGNLGENGTRRWLSMAVLPELAAGGANALILTALARAKFCEQAAIRLGLAHAADMLFLMGLFSLLDVMLSLPLAEALEGMPLDPTAKAALLSGPICPDRPLSSEMEKIWRLTLACEAADADQAAALGAGTLLRPDICAQIWTSALAWSNAICAELMPAA